MIKVYQYGVPNHNRQTRDMLAQPEMHEQFRLARRLHNDIVAAGRARGKQVSEKVWAWDSKGFGDEVKEIAKQSPVYWPTKSTVLENATKSVLSSYKHGRRPRYRSYRDDDLIGGQASTGSANVGDMEGTGLLCSAVLGENQWLRIVRAGKHHQIWMRIASDGPTPVWARLPMVYHRPLPEGIVTHAYIVRYRVGRRRKWKVTLTVKTPASDPVPDRDASWVSVDFAYRKIGKRTTRGDRAMRVVYYLGSDGAQGQLRMPSRLVSRRSFADSIRGVRDRLADETVERVHNVFVARRIKITIPKHDGTPTKWDAARVARARKGAKKRVNPIRMLERLRDVLRRVDASDDTAALDALLRPWWAREMHLSDYESGCMAHLRNARQDLFRNFARRLERKYQYALIEDFDPGRHDSAGIVTKNPELSKEKGVTERSEEQRRARRAVAAPSYAKMALLQAFGESRAVLQDARNTTIQCPECGHVNKPSPKLTWECAACGYTADCDLVACRNIASWSGHKVRSTDPQAMAMARADAIMRQTRSAKREHDAASARRAVVWQVAHYAPQARWTISTKKRGKKKVKD